MKQAEAWPLLLDRGPMVTSWRLCNCVNLHMAQFGTWPTCPNVRVGVIPKTELQLFVVQSSFRILLWRRKFVILVFCRKPLLNYHLSWCL